MLRSLVSNQFGLRNREMKRVVRRFTDESGLVYFGHVSQRDDEHHIVRGFTVSLQHTDDHYCIGTYDDYDVIFVERRDVLRGGKPHSWHIIEIDLLHARDVPHIFISSASRLPGFHELLETKYPMMLPHTLQHRNEYPAQFTDNFALHTVPANSTEAESLFSPEITQVLAKHCKGLAIEVIGDNLYVYSERPVPSAKLLQTMLTNGVWLARELDKKYR